MNFGLQGGNGRHLEDRNQAKVGHNSRRTNDERLKIHSEIKMYSDNYCRTREYETICALIHFTQGHISNPFTMLRVPRGQFTLQRQIHY